MNLSARFFYTLFAFTLSATTLSLAQPLVSHLEVDSVLSSYIKEWNRDNSVRLVVENRSDSTQVFFTESSILYEGKALASAPIVIGKAHSIAPRKSLTIASEEIFPVLKMRYADKQHLDKREGMITRSGDVTICVNLFDSTGLKGMSAANCVHRYVEQYYQSALKEPVKGDTLRNASTVHFRWTAVRPSPKVCFYRLKIFDMGNETYLNQVVRTSEALLDTSLREQLSFDWKVADSLRHRHIVWQIRSSDGDVTTYGGTDGYSEIYDFILGDEIKATAPSKKSAAESKKSSTPAAKKTNSAPKKSKH